MCLRFHAAFWAGVLILVLLVAGLRQSDAKGAGAVAPTEGYSAQTATVAPAKPMLADEEVTTGEAEPGDETAAESEPPPQVAARDYLPFVAAVTALIAVVVGPLVTLYVANRQIRSSTISANRQEWINSLRNELSDFLAAFTVASAQLSGRGHVKAESVLESADALCRIETKVRLMLNPKEDDHIALSELLSAASDMAFKADKIQSSDLAKKIDQFQADIVETSQPILKREWERVKTLE